MHTWYFRPGDASVNRSPDMHPGRCSCHTVSDSLEIEDSHTTNQLLVMNPVVGAPLSNV